MARTAPQLVKVLNAPVMMLRHAKVFCGYFFVPFVFVPRIFGAFGYNPSRAKKKPTQLPLDKLG